MESKLEAKVSRVPKTSCTTVLQCMNAVYLPVNKQDRDGATRGMAGGEERENEEETAKKNKKKKQ